MSYKLYYALGSAAMGIRVLLEEIGAPYELIQSTIDRSKPRPAESGGSRWACRIQMMGIFRIFGFFCMARGSDPKAKTNMTPGSIRGHVY